MRDQAPEQPQAYGVRIDAQPGSASIRLDGTEIGGSVVGYTLTHDVHASLPQLMLHTRQGDDVLFEGLARVAVAAQTPPGEVIVEFLASVDPDALDRAALNRTDLGGGKGAVARAMLATLTEWAQGGEI